MDKPVRHGEYHANEIIELAGDYVLGSIFVCCKFTGRASACVDCVFELSDLPSADLFLHCFFLNTNVPLEGIA